ncbi:MAG: MFS transporter, partial [Deltaproteobacteria bacterium]|nr:MFS transporter [Deltaproteobacteria bacterium]
WRIAAIGAGVAFLIMGLPLALTIRRSPESIGLRPDGDAPDDSPIPLDSAENHRRTFDEQNWSLGESLRTNQFWLITLATSCRTVCLSGLLVHLVPILVWKGYSQQQAAFYLSVIAFFGMPTHLLIGWLGDRLNKPRLMASCMALASIAIYCLFQGTHEWQLWLAIALFNLFEGLFSVTWATVGDFFGRKNFGKIRGSMSFLYTWGSVIGPVLAGAIYDRTHSYGELYWVLLIVCWLTALLYALLRRPTEKRAS